MKTNVGVVFGGRSVENEISVITANQAMAAMDTEKYEITVKHMKEQYGIDLQGIAYGIKKQ